jgi:hypothetical protein
VAKVRTVQDILFDVAGQIVFFDAPEGRPSSVTSVEVFPWSGGDDGSTESAVGAGSVESNPNTTLDGTAGSDQADPNLVPLTSTTGCEAGRVYLLTSATNEREWVEVSEVDPGSSVTVKHPIHGTYSSGAAFASTRMYATIDAAWVSDSSNLSTDAGPNPAYRVRWVYVVGGVSYVADGYFSLVRYAGAHGVRPQDVESVLPGWLDRLPTDHIADQGRRLIDEAHRGVKLDLHAVWTDDAMVANAELVDELTRWKAVELSEFARSLANGGASATSYEAAARAYQAKLDQFSRITNKAPIRDSSGAAQIRPALGLTRR